MSHYVLVTTLDDDPEEWHAIATRPSGSVRHQEWTVAKNDRGKVSIPEGRHLLRARLEVPDNGRCLVRIKQQSQDTER